MSLYDNTLMAVMATQAAVPPGLYRVAAAAEAAFMSMPCGPSTSGWMCSAWLYHVGRLIKP